MQAIVDGICEINDINSKLINDKFKKNAFKNKIDPEVSKHFASEINQSNYINYFLNSKNNGVLRSNYSRKSVYKKYFNFVEPQKVVLRRDSNHKPCHFHYVPLEQTIRTLLSDSSIQYQIKYPRKHEENLYIDFSDGNLNKTYNDEDTIKIIMYQDAFEVCNPLGSAKSKHKLLAVYYTLANLYSYNQSKIEPIQLVLLCNEKYVKYFGMEKVFAPVVAELKLLEINGISLNINNEMKNYKFRLVAVAGDNLGSHMLGGFTENFSSTEFLCRFCLFTKQNLQNGDLSKCNKRNIQNYNECVEQVSISNRLHIGGIKHNSVLNDLQHFHVSNPGLPSCIAHDLFEGIVQYDLQLIIKYIIKNNAITEIFLNVKLNSIKNDHNNNHSTVPHINIKNIKTGGQAAETRRLLQIIPLALINKIDYNDKVWKLLLMLRKAVELVCAPKLSISQTVLIDMYFNEYLNMRQECFPDISLRPKHHFITHYGEQTRQFGPLIRMWTLKFESKHSYFKNSVRHSSNFKNLTFSLSHRHQLLQAYLTSGLLFNDKVIANDAHEININIYNDKIK